jgi:Zn-dependent peptidase ImmA (M78 family)
LPRGFKTEAERSAATIREELGLDEDEPVDLTVVANHLGVRVLAADELISRERLEELERIQAYAFSACTFHIKDRKIIVVNPLHSVERQTSDIAHEIAHVYLGHELDEIREVAGVPFRTCRSDQEEQATTWGGTLLLPRPLLLAAARAGKGINEISLEYGLTVDMARFRYNTTGVGRQAGYRRARSSNR